MKKKISAILMTAAMLVSAGQVYANESNAITVLVNGEAVAFEDQAPVIQNDRTLVPLRAIFEALGATVSWDGETQTVMAIKANTIIALQIGSESLFVNNDVKKLDVPAQIINDRTMVPARAVAEAFGCQVDWDQETQTVTVNG